MNVKTDPRFWDCECSDHYIHSKNHTVCNKCGAESKDQPDSRVEELDYNNFAIGCCALNCMTQLKGKVPALQVLGSEDSSYPHEHLVQPISAEEKAEQDAYFKTLYEQQTKLVREHRIERIFYQLRNAFGDTAKGERDGEDKALITFADGAAMSIHLDYAG